MSLYRLFWPLLSTLPPEKAHELGAAALRWRLVPTQAEVHDPFTWRGITFPNRVGIAAGFDKNAEYLAGISDLRVGFVEVGTILVAPWPGQSLQPRMQRLLSVHGLWNRLGFPSDGLDEVVRRLSFFAGTPYCERMRIACNIGPHPGNLKQAADIHDYLRIVRDELLRLARALRAFADLFVVNLTSPNTPGLRAALQHEDFAGQVLAPLCDAARESPDARPLLLKLPPEDANEQPWSCETLSKLILPIFTKRLCDGFVATNTSISLARQLASYARPAAPGGVSGEPLRPLALQTVQLLRAITGPDLLLIGCGGVTRPEHAAALVTAGANLVETYTGMIYAGPGFPSACAAAIRALHPA